MSTVTSPNTEAADFPATGPSVKGWVAAALTGVMLPVGRPPGAGTGGAPVCRSSDTTRQYAPAMAHPGIEIVSNLLADAGLLTGPIKDQRAAMDAASAAAPPPEGVS